MDRIKLLIKEAEYNLEALSNGYFLNYFERDFLLKLKEINKNYAQDIEMKNKLQKIISLIYKKCNELADTYPVAQFQEEIKDIIKNEVK